MELRLFPQPTDECITPFVESEAGVYRCLDETGKLTEISCRDETLCLPAMGAQRVPDRERLLEWAEQNGPVAFGQFVAATTVVPTFSGSATEALVRVVMRQIVTRLQARRTYAKFIRLHGQEANGVYGFPGEDRIRLVTQKDFEDLGMGFRAERLIEAIALRPREPDVWTGALPGIGPWSQAVLECDAKRDYSHYPMWDKSGEVAGRLLGVSMEECRARNAGLAADLYVYALSWAETDS